MKGILLILIIAGAGYYFYQQNENNKEEIDPNLTINQLMTKLSSDTVSSNEAKIAFKNSILELCKVNGTDPRNGFGTTSQCITKFESINTNCFNTISNFENTKYSSTGQFQADFKKFFRCSAKALSSAR